MIRRVGLSLLLLFALEGVALGQDETFDRPPIDEGWSVYLGGGVLYTPAYPGDDDHYLTAVPFIRVTKGDEFVASVQEGMRYAAVNDGGFKAGPMATLEFGRDEDGKNPFRVSGARTTDLLGLGDIDTSISLGAFAEYDAGEITFKASAGKALWAHDGVTGQIGADYRTVVKTGGPPLFFSAGPNLKFGDGKFSQAYFGITQAQALASGLPAFEADGGITSYGASGNLILPLSRGGDALLLLASYDRLTGDAGDSPLVRQRGSRDQFFTGLAAAKKF